MASELGGGILLALGLATRPACLLLIITMLVAGIVGHRGTGYPTTNDPPGAEYTMNLAVVCLMFWLIGPGAISLDTAFFQAQTGRKAPPRPMLRVPRSTQLESLEAC
jgi:putative oxidoreductase